MTVAALRARPDPDLPVTRLGGAPRPASAGRFYLCERNCGSGPRPRKGAKLPAGYQRSLGSGLEGSGREGAGKVPEIIQMFVAKLEDDVPVHRFIIMDDDIAKTDRASKTVSQLLGNFVALRQK